MLIMLFYSKVLCIFPKNKMPMPNIMYLFLIKGTVMQIEKVLINERLRVSKVS